MAQSNKKDLLTINEELQDHIATQLTLLGICKSELAELREFFEYILKNREEKK